MAYIAQPSFLIGRPLVLFGASLTRNPLTNQLEDPSAVALDTQSTRAASTKRRMLAKLG
jgi:hypothetical protein